MQNMTPEQMEAMREMMRDLNQMLRDRMEGRDPGFRAIHAEVGANVRGRPAPEP